jgi:hypothetical protein
MNEIMRLIEQAQERLRELDRTEYANVTPDDWHQLERCLMGADRYAFIIGNKQDPTG